MSTREQRLAAAMGKLTPNWLLQDAGPLAASVVSKASRDELFADLTPPNGTRGVVYGDPDYSGIYFKEGSSGSGNWVFSASLQGDAMAALIGSVPASASGVDTVVGVKNGVSAKVEPTGRTSLALPGVHFGLPDGFGPGTGAIINGVAAGLGAGGGGTLKLPTVPILLDETIDNKYPRVLIEAEGGRRMVHSVAASYGCKLVPTFAGTVLRHRSPRAAETGGVAQARNDGGGFRNITVVGNGIAKKLLEVDSVQMGIYHLFLEDCDGDTALPVNQRYAAEFLCGLTGTDLSEATNIQKMSCRLVVRQLSAGNPRDCGGVRFAGSANSNVCFNDDIDLDIQHYNGTALRGDSADNNKLTFRAYRPGGTGISVYAVGRKGEVVGFEGNWFERYSTNVAGYAEGTGDTDVTQGVTNNIERLDDLNGTPLPTAGTGSMWTSINWAGLMRNFAMMGLVISDNPSTAIAEMKALGSKGLVIANGSESHITLQNNSAAAKWLTRIITASGNLQILRQAGSGYLDLAGVDAKVNGLRLTDGIGAPSAVASQTQIFVDAADGDLKILFSDGATITIPDVTSTVMTRQTAETVSGLKTFSLPPVLPSYTVATLPSAATYTRGAIYVSDGTGNKRLAISDGANWRFADGAIVS